jgi:ornithine carbamoyltransferase
MKRDLTSFAGWSGERLAALLTLAAEMKRAGPTGPRPLHGKSAALIFERESLRTRVSFEVGIAQLGGHPVMLQHETIGMATRESVHDIGLTLSHYNDFIIARTVKHQTIVQLAESASVPVINAMTDLVHPCQILADVLTLQEAERFSPSVKLVYLGDGNNIANSWLELAEKFPLHLVLSCPAGYEPHPLILEQARSAGVSRIDMVADPVAAVREADAVYTDRWPSHREGMEEGRRQNVFRPYQVNAALLKHARPECLVMHRLPANRGEEVTSEVLDGPRSVVMVQAENRLHVQKAIMAILAGGQA